MTLTRHPLSATWGDASKVVAKDLAADIKLHGLREPGVMFENQVLDGWQRYQACLAAGIDFQTVQFEGDFEADQAFVVSKNARRRHLTGGQRATAIVRIYVIPLAGSNQHEFKAGGQEATSRPLKTLDELAKLTGLSRKTIQQGRKLVEMADAGNPTAVKELADVHAGRTNVADALYRVNGANERREEPVTVPAPAGSCPDFDRLLAEIMKRYTSKTLQPSEVSATLAEVGVKDFPVLATRPDLVPVIAAKLGMGKPIAQLPAQAHDAFGILQREAEDILHRLSCTGSTDPARAAEIARALAHKLRGLTDELSALAEHKPEQVPA
jgi:hypothetical protein